MESTQANIVKNVLDILSSNLVKELCIRYHIKRLSLYGSILTEGFNSDSDIDILIEFIPGAVVGYLKLAELELELTGMLGHKIDLRTPAELSRYFRDDVMQHAKVIYAA